MSDQHNTTIALFIFSIIICWYSLLYFIATATAAAESSPTIDIDPINRSTSSWAKHRNHVLYSFLSSAVITSATNLLGCECANSSGKSSIMARLSYAATVVLAGWGASCIYRTRQQLALAERRQGMYGWLWSEFRALRDEVRLRKEQSGFMMSEKVLRVQEMNQGGGDTGQVAVKVTFVERLNLLTLASLIISSSYYTLVILSTINYFRLLLDLRS